jgi:phosphonate transport system substrate-binding protein
MFVVKRLCRPTSFFAIVLSAGLGSRAVAQTAVDFKAKTMTLGIVAETHHKEIEGHFQEFVRYVAAKISGSTAPMQGRVLVATTQSRLANLLREKRVDFYMESSHPTYMINNVYGVAKLLLRRWKGGMADYHAAIFTNKSGETKRLEDLKGKILAFEDNESTSGFFLPRQFLIRKGFRLSQKAQIDAAVGRDEIGYIFAQSQGKLVDLVLAKKVAAGAFSNDDYATLDANKKTEITILAETASLPRHLVSVRNDLPSAVVKGLEKTLLSMHQNSEGRSILQKADGTTKFDALPGGELAVRQRLLDIYYSPQKQ